MDLKDIAYIGSAAILIFLPLALAIIIRRKFKVSWAIFFLGLLMFLVTLAKTPINNYLGNLLKLNFSGELFYLLYGIMSALTVGILEEGTRLLAIGAIIKPKGYYKGVMYGAGFGGGGASMFIMGLLTIGSYIIYNYFPNILPVNVISEIKTQIWYLPFTGAFEKVLGISIQIAFSILVMYSFMSKKYYIILLTIILHFIIEFGEYYINYKFGFWYKEISIFVFAIIGLLIILLFKPKNQKKAESILNINNFNL